MREIQFRGKTIEAAGLRGAGEWAFGGYFVDDCYGGCPEGKHHIVEWVSTGMGYFNHTRVEKETVGEYTGIKDVNGKKIFEGDIIRKTIDNPNNLPYKKEFNIKNDQFVGVVIYQDGMFFIEDYERTAGLELFSETDTNEVIGNIYDDKDSFAFKW